MTTNHPKTYDQALKESFAEHVANTRGRSEYMKPDFDAGFSAGYNTALHDRERELRERAAIAAMQGMIANPERHQCLNETVIIARRYADALVKQLNTPQS